MKKVDKKEMALGYIEMGKINLSLSNDYLLSEEEGYKKGCEYIAI